MLFGACDLRGASHSIESTILEVKRSHPPGDAAGVPEVLFLIGIDADQVPDVAVGLNMQSCYYPQLFQRVGTVRGDRGTGVCILSNHPLYDAGPLTAEAGLRIGAKAIAVVNGQAFLVACVDPKATDRAQLVAALSRWCVYGEQPAVTYCPLPAAANPSTALTSLFKTHGQLLTTSQWAGKEPLHRRDDAAISAWIRLGR